MTWTCAHCGQLCGDYAGGLGAVSYGGPMTRLCHPNDPGRPDCYRRVTVYQEELGALTSVDPKPAGVAEIVRGTGEAVFSKSVLRRLETMGEPVILRHGDHDPGMACRPAGTGLCEPLDQDEAYRFLVWQDTVRLGAGLQGQAEACSPRPAED